MFAYCTEQIASQSIKKKNNMRLQLHEYKGIVIIGGGTLGIGVKDMGLTLSKDVAGDFLGTETTILSMLKGERERSSTCQLVGRIFPGRTL